MRRARVTGSSSGSDDGAAVRAPRLASVPSKRSDRDVLHISGEHRLYFQIGWGRAALKWSNGVCSRALGGGHGPPRAARCREQTPFGHFIKRHVIPVRVLRLKSQYVPLERQEDGHVRCQRHATDFQGGCKRNHPKTRPRGRPIVRHRIVTLSQ